MFMFAASIASGATTTGGPTSRGRRASPRMRDFWVGWSYFEATVWTLDYLVGGVALYKVVINRKDALRGGGASPGFDCDGAH